MEYRDRVFATGEVVGLDGNTYIGCTFDGASLHYEGTTPGHFQGCHFKSFNVEFRGAAKNTLQFLQGLSASGGHEMVERLFRRDMRL
jgi:hypothetical protein